MAKDKSRVSPFVYPVLEQAGGGPLVATLTDDVSYELVGPRVLYLDSGDANRTVTLPDAEYNHNGDKWVVRATGSSGRVLFIEDESGTSIVTISDRDEATVRNARGVYMASVVQGTIGSDTEEGAAIIGGRLNSAVYDDDFVTAATSDGAYVAFYLNCPIPGGTFTPGTRASILASIFVSDAAAGTETLQTKLTIGPRYDVWELVVDTNSNTEAYGVNMRFPTAASVSYTSDGSATKPEIADGLAAAWNADVDCAAAATAVSDGVDAVTFTSIQDQWLSIEEDENAAKVTLTQTVDSGDVALVETTAVDQAGDDFQALDFELNSIGAPSATSEISGVGSWMTNTGGTLANSVEILLPTDFDTSNDLIVRAWAKWSASAATTTARLAFLTVRSE